MPQGHRGYCRGQEMQDMTPAIILNDIYAASDPVTQAGMACDNRDTPGPAGHYNASPSQSASRGMNCLSGSSCCFEVCCSNRVTKLVIFGPLISVKLCPLLDV